MCAEMDSAEMMLSIKTNKNAAYLVRKSPPFIFGNVRPMPIPTNM